MSKTASNLDCRFMG
uniref:Uncharacterized protein n=1 Tax=Anguilla anguilla TaxID=7936 RepID=A0A0E9VBX9_ANGAN